MDRWLDRLQEAHDCGDPLRQFEIVLSVAQGLARERDAAIMALSYVQSHKTRQEWLDAAGMA